jgi:hypothetical protein
MKMTTAATTDMSKGNEQELMYGLSQNGYGWFIYQFWLIFIKNATKTSFWCIKKIADHRLTKEPGISMKSYNIGQYLTHFWLIFIKNVILGVFFFSRTTDLQRNPEFYWTLITYFFFIYYYNNNNYYYYYLFIYYLLCIYYLLYIIYFVFICY